MFAARGFRWPTLAQRTFLAAAALPVAIGLGTLAVAYATLVPLLRRVGHPGATLDDAYIHFQYARSYAEGHPLRFQAGEPRSSGGTSFAWPAVLAVFYACGLHGESILWAAWGLSFAALAGLAWEAAALTRRLAQSEVAAWFAAALVVAFGPFAWFAASGMEVVPFAWILARLVRLAASDADDHGEQRARRRRRIEITALAYLGPLARPEGSALTVLVALLILSNRRLPRRVRVPWAASVGFGAVLPTLLLHATTGHATSSTAQVKLLSGDPYLHGAGAFIDVIGENLVTAVTDCLDGGSFSAEFLPAHSAAFLFAGLGAVAYCSLSKTRGAQARAHGLLVLGLAALLFVPCGYVTFLWNRLRYLWPFATAWIVGVACLASLVSALLVGLLPRDLRWPKLAPLLTSLQLAGALYLVAAHLPMTMWDVVDSASGVDRQQASLGRWVKKAVPPGVRIGVNDTGAIAYFGEHPTFDIVGLTSPGEARFWVAGAASRFEHYEQLVRTSPASFPDVFIVYPPWFAIPPLLGEPLATRSVYASILGGVVMTAFRSDRTVLGSGETPWSLAPGAEVVDTLDVADIDSEAAHSYELLGTTVYDETIASYTLPGGKLVVDGGRSGRMSERFTASPTKSDGASCSGILRYAAKVDVKVNASVLGSPTTFTLPATEFEEVTYPIGPHASSGGATSAAVRLDFSAPIDTFHHWIVCSPLR